MNTQYKYIETNDVDPKLKCSICENPFEKPRSCQMCGKRFCFSCIKDKKECPECKDTTDWDACPKKFIEQLSKLKVACNVCDKEMTRKEFETHFTGCKITKCEGSIYGCDFLDKASVVAEHQKTCFKSCLLLTRREFDEKLETEKKKRINKQKEMVAKLRILETELDSLRRATKPESVDNAIKNRKKMMIELENKFKKERESIDKNGKSPIKKSSTTKKLATPVKGESKSTTAIKTLTTKTETPKKNGTPKKTETPKKTDTPKNNEIKEDKPNNNNKTETKTLVSETKTLVSKKDAKQTEKSNETNANEITEKKELVNAEDYKDTNIPLLISKKKKKSNTQETESSSGSKKRKKNPK